MTDDWRRLMDGRPLPVPSLDWRLQKALDAASARPEADLEPMARPARPAVVTLMAGALRLVGSVAGAWADRLDGTREASAGLPARWPY
jgi:hypothetical protein